MSTVEPRQQEILADVAEMIREIVAEDWVRDLEIGMETSFATDLELESIEIVALSEKLQEHYGDRVDFVGWLSGMEIDEIISLRVGQLVEFIESCL
jgi:acyl carrier protein